MRLDIVIPARGEALTIGAALAAILADAQGLTLAVYLALNGEDQDAARAAAAPYADAFARQGHSLAILGVRTAGKPAALNAGDAARSGGAVLYCDADAVFRRGSLAALAHALDSPHPRLAGPQRAIIMPRGWAARSYTRVWQALPQVRCFIGAGCYGVNAAGRSRWGRFPDIIADDAFVFSRFAPAERIIPDAAVIAFTMPEGKDLLRAVRRWREGNEQLRALAATAALPPPAQPAAPQDWRWLRDNPRLAASLPGFALVQLLSRLTPSPVTGSGWSPRRGHAADKRPPSGHS